MYVKCIREFRKWCRIQFRLLFIEQKKKMKKRIYKNNWYNANEYFIYNIIFYIRNEWYKIHAMICVWKSKMFASSMFLYSQKSEEYKHWNRIFKEKSNMITFFFLYLYTNSCVYIIIRPIYSSMFFLIQEYKWETKRNVKNCLHGSCVWRKSNTLWIIIIITFFFVFVSFHGMDVGANYLERKQNVKEMKIRKKNRITNAIFCRN